MYYVGMMQWLQPITLSWAGLQHWFQCDAEVWTYSIAGGPVGPLMSKCLAGCGNTSQTMCCRACLAVWMNSDDWDWDMWPSCVCATGCDWDLQVRYMNALLLCAVHRLL